MDEAQQRASDSEREAATDRLRTAAEEGRLDVDELDQRVAAALSARTHADLERLTADLPAGPPPPRAAVPVWQRRDVRGALAALLSAGGICTLVWLATGAHSPFWPVWVFMGTGIALIATLSKALRGDDERDRERDRDRNRDRDRGGLPGPPPPPAPPGS